MNFIDYQSGEGERERGCFDEKVKRKKIIKSNVRSACSF